MLSEIFMRSIARLRLLLVIGTVLIGHHVVVRAQEHEPTPEEIGAVEVLSTEDDALTQIFPKADSMVAGYISLDSVQRGHLKEQLGRRVFDTGFAYYTLYREGALHGYALIAGEKGKYRPITFMAGIDTTMRIVDVRVLVYRESRGGEVRRKRFLRQYRGKDLADPIRINRDIINISGATISVHALNAGVRKALAVTALIHSESRKERP
jgi:Na+-translocating ferredoxin:NAD+ oxidoreductase RnfG subunit